MSSLITSGKLKAGDEIPPVRKLSRAWPASHVVIQRALARCAQLGLLLRCQGRRTVVADSGRIKANVFCKNIFLVIEQTEEEAKSCDFASSHYFIRLLSGLQQGMAASGVVISAVTITGREQQKNFCLQLKKQPADLILLMRSRNPEFIRLIRKSGIPLVSVEPHLPASGCLVIDHDEVTAAQNMIAGFMSRGCSKIAVLIFNDHKKQTNLRLQCLQAAAQKAGIYISPDLIKMPVKRDPDCLSFVLKKLFSDTNPPDSLIISGIGNEVLTSAWQKSGINIHPVTGMYAVDAQNAPASFAIAIDGYDFGKNIALYIDNIFYKKQKNFSSGTFHLPYSFINLKKHNSGAGK
ncbi:MAG TPA: hypothetical protein DC049_05150 [Spirochaetia bacterium]|nr:hypothetical protein [Spirochaetia bacterium]